MSGLEVIMLSGVRPIISLAILPTDIILLSKTEIATTDGSLMTIPFLGMNTTVLVVPRSIPIFAITTCRPLCQLCFKYLFSFNIRAYFLQSFFYFLVPSVYLIYVINDKNWN